MKFMRSLLLISLLFITMAPSFTSSQPLSEPMKQSLTPISITRSLNSVFAGQVISTTNWKIVFYTNGTISTSEPNAQLTIIMPTLIGPRIFTSTLWFNSSFIGQSLTSGSTTVWAYYNLTDNTSASIKQSIIGTMPSPQNMTIRFSSNALIGSTSASVGPISYVWQDVNETVFPNAVSPSVSIPISGNFAIDPVITTAISGTAASMSTQRKLQAVTQSGTVYTYAFWANLTSAYYSVSTNDGGTWNTPTAISTTNGIHSGDQFGIRYRNYSGTDYVYLAYANGTNTAGAGVRFMRGSVSTTTITWGTEYTVQAPDTAYRMGNPDVESATDGRVFVAYMRSGIAPNWISAARCMSCTANDGSGTWGDVNGYNSGFGAAGNLVYVSLTRLTGTNGTTKVYFASTADNQQIIKGNLWNGTLWESGASGSETITSTCYEPFFSIDSYGNQTYAMWCNSSSNYPVFRSRSLSSPKWGTATQISSDAAGSIVMGVNQTNGDIWGTWCTASFTAIDYTQYNGTWQATLTIYNPTGGETLQSNTLNIFYDVVNNTIGMMWCSVNGITTSLIYKSLSVLPYPDITPPTYLSIFYSTTSAGAVCNIQANFTDNINMSGWIYGDNNTGTWTNTTWTNTWSLWSSAGNGALATVTETLNSTYNELIQFEFWANDTNNNWANTGIWILVTTATMIRNYTQTTANEGILLRSLHPSANTYASAASQSFNMSEPSSYKITSCVFRLKNFTSLTGIAHAALYEISGTSGSTSIPTGSALATSDGVDLSTARLQNLTDFIYYPFTFNSTQQYAMSANHNYSIAYLNPATGNIDANHIMLIQYVSSGSDAGNAANYTNGAWSAMSAADVPYILYGAAVSVGVAVTLNGNVAITFSPSGAGSSWIFRLAGISNLAFTIRSGGTSTAARFRGNALINFQPSGTPLVSILTKSLLIYGEALIRFTVQGFANLPEIPVDLIYAMMATIVAPAVIAGYLVMRRRRKCAATETNQEE